MAENRDKEPTFTAYERIKNKLLNNWVIAIVVLLAFVSVFAINMLKGVIDLIDRLFKEEKITLTATVSDGKEEYCGPINVDGEDYNFQRNIIDFSINNQSDKNQVLKSVILKPLGINANFWSGPSEVVKVYDIDVSDWYSFINEKKWFNDADAPELELRRSTSLPIFTPEPIEVTEISKEKYEINAGEHERIQLKLGLHESNWFLYGNIKIIIETDFGVILESDPLWITVCTSIGEKRSNR